MFWERASSSVGGCGSMPYSAAHFPFNPSASEPPIRPNPMIATFDSARLKSGSFMLRDQLTIHRLCNRLELLHHLGKGLRGERLLAIRDGMCGVVMHFDDDTICTCSHTGFCDRRNISSIAC